MENKMARILIVEDNSTNMELVTLMLEKAGHRVIQAQDAQVGMQKCRRELPDLVLMDVQLPGMSGLEATAVLKANSATQAIPIIALTAQAMSGDKERCLAAGCDGYLSKPLHYKILWSTVAAQLLSSSKKAQPYHTDRTQSMGTKARTILIVDDERLNCDLLEVMLRHEGYTTTSVTSGVAALKSIERHPPDLILIDVMMPIMSGNEVVKKLKGDPKTKSIPVIIVTSLVSRASKLEALSYGAEEFLTKPVDRAELLLRVRNMLRLKDYSDLLTDYNETLENRVQERTHKLNSAYKETIFTMVRAAGYKDRATGAHVRRIAQYSSMLSQLMGLDKEFVEAIFNASPMHDIGKIGIPDEILFKPSALTSKEWVIMKTHSLIGAEILRNGDSPYAKMGAAIALSHHENWDGSGYPNGISGQAIPLPARIMSLCDVYDALRSKRPYKSAFSHVKAVKIIVEGDGRTMPEHFDPAVLAVFSAHADRFRDIYEDFDDK
jgi:putative two-component system response regulator